MTSTLRRTRPPATPGTPRYRRGSPSPPADRYEQNATPEGMVGVGGIRTWTLVPENPGVFAFSAVYRRPWENVTGTEDRFDLTITAVADLLDVPSG